MAALSLNKHQQKTEVTKRKLLDAALRVFSRDGFEGSRIDDIARDAGYTRGAFYANFQSKEALFFALLEEQSEQHIQVLNRAMAKCQTGEERLQALRDYYIRKAGDRKWSILILEFKLYALRRPKLRAKLAAGYRNVRRNMKTGEIGRMLCDETMWSAEKQEVIRVTLQTMLHGLVVERAYDPSSLSEEQQAELLGRIFDFIVTRPQTG